MLANPARMKYPVENENHSPTVVHSRKEGMTISDAVVDKISKSGIVVKTQN